MLLAVPIPGGVSEMRVKDPIQTFNMAQKVITVVLTVKEIVWERVEENQTIEAF